MCNFHLLMLVVTQLCSLTNCFPYFLKVSVIPCFLFIRLSNLDKINLQPSEGLGQLGVNVTV